MVSGNPAPHQESSSRRLGPYVVRGELSRSRTGAVLDAYDETLDRPVAVKVLAAELTAEQTERQRRLARTLAKIDHHNVVQVLEVGDAEGRVFIAMQRVRGQTLGERTRAAKPGWRKNLMLYLQAARGLAAAHEVGLVHGDFGPDRAIVDAEGRVIVLGFGEAQTLETSQGVTTGDDGRDALEVTNTEAIAASPYASVEQLEGRAADERSDQFSFCASVYEAVYGELPELDGNRLRSSSKQGTAPAALWGTLERGLAKDPEARWPSMNALLEGLESIAAPRPRRWPAAALTVGAVAIGAALWARSNPEPTTPCADARSRLAGIWDEERRQQVETALSGASVPYAASTWERVASRLDGYADDWANKHTEVCEATAVAKTQDDQTLDLRMACLDEGKAALHAVVDVLAQTDAKGVEKAVDIAADLPRLASCDDVERLAERRERLPPPEDPQTAREVETQRQRLREIDARRNAAAYAEAREQSEQVVERAVALSYAPLEAEARLRLGRLHENEGHYPEAERELLRAHELALQHAHDEVVLLAARSLALVVGDRQARYEEGLQWLDTALPLARRSGDARQVAGCLDRKGVVLGKQKRFDEAAEAHREALAIIERESDTQMLLPHSLDGLGVVLSNQAQHEEAERLHRRALEIRRSTQPEGHPSIAHSLHNLGHDLTRQGKYAEAETFYRESNQILEEALGPQHPSVAVTSMSLGAALEPQGKYDEAETQYLQALGIFEKVLGPDHPHVGFTVNNLGNLLHQRGDFAGAVVQHRRALAAFEAKLGHDHLNAAMSANNLGSALNFQGRHEEAERHLRHALEVREAKLGPEHPDVATTSQNLGDALVQQGRTEEAEALYRRSLAIRRATLGPEHPRYAENLSVLASVHGLRGNHEEAERLHRQAVELSEKALGPDHGSVAAHLTNLGQELIDQARHAEALPLLRRALEIKERALGNDSSRLVVTLVALANAQLAGPNPGTAREHAQRAVSLLEQRPAGPLALANARFALARALWPDGDREVALELAQQARDAFAEHGAEDQRDLVAAQRWLAQHRPR